jgi:CRP/FNR family transcriptional regulator
MDRAAILRSFPLLHGAGDVRLQELARSSVWRTWEEGEPIWRAGDTALHVLLVRNGLVQILRRLASGEESTIALFGPREHVGLVAVMDGAPFPADAVVVSEQLEGILVPAAAFLAGIAREPVMLRSATTGVVRRASSLRAKIDILTAGEIDRRLATLFLHLATRFGDEREDGELVVPLALTRRMLARLVGAREETVSRVLSRWERDATVSTEGGHFFLHDVPLLEATAAGA